MVYNVPLARTENGRDTFKSKNPKRRWQRLATDIRKCYVGPMPVDEFIETFLPVGSTSDNAMSAAGDTFMALSAQGDSECEMDICRRLVSAPSIVV